MYLCDKLEKYGEQDIYPFHMPGHKRNPSFIKTNASAIDITEIDGFDDLHDATGIIKEEQERAARLFGSDESFFLVNGSTCGNLTGICATVPMGGKVIAARGCHKSVYNGIELRQAEAVYVEPEAFFAEEIGCCDKSAAGCVGRNFPDGTGLGKIQPKVVEEALFGNPDASLVIITSPTYEGVGSDVKKIAKICHEHKVPLMVDAAHGAHLKFASAAAATLDTLMAKQNARLTFPEDAVSSGADIVVNSLHKTLPAMTGTSLLHVNTKNGLVDMNLVRHFLDIYQTSSPSYVLMSSISSCLKFLESPGAKEQFQKYIGRLVCFYKAAKSFKHIRVLPFEGRDPGKIMILAPDGMSGFELMRILREEYRIEMEYASDRYVLAMTSICDTDDGFKRLADALSSIPDAE